MNKRTLIGDCRNEELVDDIFGSVSEFARIVDEKGDNFLYGKYAIIYNEKNDIHYFYLR
jgi:hypothetical protein